MTDGCGGMPFVGPLIPPSSPCLRLFVVSCSCAACVVLLKRLACFFGVLDHTGCFACESKHIFGS